MSDLEVFIEKLKKSGKTSINSDDETKNVSIPQMEIIAGYLMQNSEAEVMNLAINISDIFKEISNYLVSQEEEAGKVILQSLKKLIVKIYMNEIESLFK